MVGTPLEVQSPRMRGSATTPPVSARGLNSARGRPLASARGARSAPGTPRPTNDQVHVIIRMRPPRDNSSSEPIRYSIERSPLQPTPRTLDPMPSTPGRSNTVTSSTSLTISGPAEGAPGLEEHRSYEFTDVVEPSQDLPPIVTQVMDQLRNGFNASVLCYGQTGSGKTYTMQQITSSIVESVFGSTNAVASVPSSNGATPSDMYPAVGSSGALVDPERDIVEISYIQIYGNRSYDLLMCSSRNGSGGGASASASHRPAGGGGNSNDPMGELLPKPKGVLVSEPFLMIRSAQELYQRISEAQKRRVVTNHALNPMSSRSHTLLSIRISKCIDGTTVQAVKVTLADLAGSERVKKSGVAGENLDEAIAINKSLSVLHAVIKASADQDGSTLVPFRESVLTLHLAPVLTNSCLFLVTNISLEVSNYFETKSALEFATTAKKCIITRTKSMQLSERFRTNRSQEAIDLQLQQEIETLRQRVDLLQQELDLERQKRETLSISPGLMSSSLAMGQTAHDSLLREHIHHLEIQFSSLQSLLKDREAEKMLLMSRRNLVDDIRRELEQRHQEREDARNALAQLVSSSSDGMAGQQLPTQSSESIVAAIDKVCESFLWLEEEYQKAVECCEIYARTMAALRNEHVQSEQTVLELRRRVLTLEKERIEATELVEDLTSTSQALTLKYQELEFNYYREKQERATNEECQQLHHAANFRHTELEKVRTAFEDQRTLMEALQSRLAEVERQLEASEVNRMKLAEENRARMESMCLAWSLFTPQQRGRYLSSDPSSSLHTHLSASTATPSTVTPVGLSSSGGLQHAFSTSHLLNSGSTSAPQQPSSSSSVFQGYDNVQLRSTVRDLQKQVQETHSQLDHKNYRIEDLEEEVKLLQERLHHRDDEYATLLRLDGQHLEQNEEMQSQIADLFSYIDAHNARQEFLESRWKETQQEVEKLEDERKQSQRMLNELTNKLDKAMEELRTHEQNKDLLTARLREAEAEKTTIARMRAEDQARVAELERQLQKQQTYSNDISRRLDLAVNRRHHIAAEINHHAVQGEVLQKKLVRANGEEAKKRIAQLIKGVDQGRVLLVSANNVVSAANRDPAALAEMMQRSNKVANLRFEVSQLFRQQTAQRLHDYDAVASLQASPLDGNFPPNAVSSAVVRHRDPIGPGPLHAHMGVSGAAPPVSGMRAPPPPLQLSNLRHGTTAIAQPSSQPSTPHNQPTLPPAHESTHQPIINSTLHSVMNNQQLNSRKSSAAQAAQRGQPLPQPIRLHADKGLHHFQQVQQHSLGQPQPAGLVRSISPNRGGPTVTRGQIPAPPSIATIAAPMTASPAAPPADAAPSRPVVPKLMFKKSVAR